MMLRPLAVVAVTFASMVAQQRTLVVDRSTGPYTEISAALAAARPGDRIEVHPGSYASFTVSIGVDIVAPSGCMSAGIIVQNLPAANAVRIDGIGTSMLSISSCAGIVHVHRVAASGTQVQNSPRVAMTRSSFTGLGLVQSSVVLESCSMHGVQGASATPTYPYPGDGGSGLYLQQSRAFLTDCTIVGGDGGFGYPYSFRNGYGAIAAGGDSTSSLHAVGTGSFTGGRNAYAFSLGPPNAGISFPPNAARLGPGVTVTSPGTPVTAIQEPPHVIAPQLLPAGTVVAIQVTDTANQAVLLGIDLWNDLIAIPGVELPFVLTTAASLYAFAPPTPASTAQFPLAVPSAPWLLHQFVHLQAVTVTSAATLQCSTGGYGRIN